MICYIQEVLDNEWKKKSVLPVPRFGSPPPSSPQKVHKVAEPAAPAVAGVPPAPATPARAPAPIAQPAPAPPPVVQNPPPTAITTTFVYAKPVPIRPRSAQRMGTPEMDVDVGGMSSEPDGSAEDVGERDPESEKIVKQLEKGLPRWPGLGQEGWMNETTPVSEVAPDIPGIQTFAGALSGDCVCR